MKHSGIELEAMASIAKAAKVRSLEDFQAAVRVYLLSVCVYVSLFCHRKCASKPRHLLVAKWLPFYFSSAHLFLLSVHGRWPNTKCT